MIKVNIALVLLAAISYLLGLSSSVCEKRISKKLLCVVSIGILSGICVSASIVTIIVLSTNYNIPPSPASLLVYVPIVEEFSKFIGVFLSLLFLQKRLQIYNLKIVRLGGGIGLGFGIFETFNYIVEGANVQATVQRLLVSVPFHISSAMLIGYGFTQWRINRAVTMLLTAISFHALSNFLAIYDWLLQGIVFWILLLILYFFTELPTLEIRRT